MPIFTQSFQLGMSRIFPFVFLLCLSVFSGIHSGYAQSDSAKKKEEQIQIVDSEKNNILTKQNEQIQALQAGRIGDSIRLIELKDEILQLGSADNARKQALSTERDQIINRDTVRYQILKLKIDSVRALVNGFPVFLGQDTLFYIYAKLGSFSPKERADALNKRLLNLSKDFFFNGDSLSIIPADLTTDIVYKENVIKSVSEMDAIWENSTREQLAEKYRIIIVSAIKKYKAENNWKTMTRDISLAILVLVILIVIIYLITRFFGWIKSKIEKQRGSKFKGLKFREYEFLDTNRQVNVLFSALNVLQWVIILVLIYMTLPVLLGIFPWTGGFAGKLISYFLDPIKKILVSIWNYLPNLFTIIVLVFFFRYLLRLLVYFKTEIEKGRLKIKGFYVDWANPTFQIIRVLMLAFMLIIIFPYLPGSDSPIFKGVSVFLGVLFTFGSAGALGNIVAGLVLTYMRAYKIGDRVQIGPVTGDVVEKSLLVTRIKTIKNEIVSIPNSTVMSNHTTNYSADASEHGLILHTSVTIGYDAPWRQIHELLIKAALATDLIEKNPAPFVFQEKLDDFYVAYQINAYTRAPNQQHIIYSFLHQHIQDAFNEAGVEIMSSHYSNIRDGNKSTVPADHLPKDYVSPSFKVKDTTKDTNIPTL
jgi:small-conductance mechanosensitive channel